MTAYDRDMDALAVEFRKGRDEHPPWTFRSPGWRRTWARFVWWWRA